jgi:hypothetical protein
MSDNGQKWVNTELRGELVGEFERVKAYHGIGSNADVVRFLVRKEAREIDGRRQERVSMEAED